MEEIINELKILNIDCSNLKNENLSIIKILIRNLNENLNSISSLKNDNIKISEKNEELKKVILSLKEHINNHETKSEMEIKDLILKIKK